MAAYLFSIDCEGFLRMDGIDVDMLWNGSEEGGNIRDLCQEDEGTDCEDGDWDTDW